MKYKSTLKNFFWITVAYFVACTVIGGIRQFSPVPFFDIWDGAIEFYLNFEKTHDWRLWWNQHNEHRILLARIFFWLDFKFFNGTGLFLILLNYAFLFSVVALFIKFIQESKVTNQQFIYPFSVAWLVLWIQLENLIWGFQVQFWMAQLFPLLAFYFFYKSQKNNKNTYLVLSLLCALLAIGSMANGVLVVPLLFLYSILIRVGFLKSLTIFIVGFLEIVIYFSNYNSPGHHGSLTNAVLNNPVNFANYILLYLGSPFVSMFAFNGYEIIFGKLCGLLFVITFLSILVLRFQELIKQRSIAKIEDALICYLSYMFITALGTAGGRLIFGVEQSLSSRYTTPVLMGWLSLFLVVYIRISPKIRSNWVQIGLLSVLLALLPVQTKALFSSNSVKFDRAVAALAITLNIPDINQLNFLWPLTDKMLTLGKEVKVKNTTIFSKDPLNSVPEKINTQVTIGESKNCSGALEGEIGLIPNTNWIKLKGWFNVKNGGNLIWIVDKRLKIVGAAITEAARNDIRNQFQIEDRQSGFLGYVDAESVHHISYLVSKADGCIVKVR